MRTNTTVKSLRGRWNRPLRSRSETACSLPNNHAGERSLFQAAEAKPAYEDVAGPKCGSRPRMSPEQAFRLPRNGPPGSVLQKGRTGTPRYQGSLGGGPAPESQALLVAISPLLGLGLP